METTTSRSVAFTKASIIVVFLGASVLAGLSERSEDRSWKTDRLERMPVTIGFPANWHTRTYEFDGISFGEDGVFIGNEDPAFRFQSPRTSNRIEFVGLSPRAVILRFGRAWGMGGGGEPDALSKDLPVRASALKMVTDYALAEGLPNEESLRLPSGFSFRRWHGALASPVDLAISDAIIASVAVTTSP
jgi:hypothetical protein